MFHDYLQLDYGPHPVPYFFLMHINFQSICIQIGMQEHHRGGRVFFTPPSHDFYTKPPEEMQRFQLQAWWLSCMLHGVSLLPYRFYAWVFGPSETQIQSRWMCIPTVRPTVLSVSSRASHATSGSYEQHKINNTSPWLTDCLHSRSRPKTRLKLYTHRGQHQQASSLGVYGDSIVPLRG